MLRNAKIPILGIAAYSGTGKTTLLVQLISLFKVRGFRVGVVKHAHHYFSIDQPGKDSYELRNAGAVQTLIGSKLRWALMTERDEEQEPDLDDLIRHFDQEVLDFILVEGFKHVVFPKIELHRPSLGRPLIFPDNPSVVAIATDGPLAVSTTLPVLDLNRIDELGEFVINRLLACRPGPPADRSRGIYNG